MVRPIVSAGTAGIGYVNNTGSSLPSLSALGWDASRSAWPSIMTHEMGHNFSRQHAPCGGAAGPDPKYPYAGGALSATPLFESLLDDIQSPANQFDVMGYCSGKWFSDYNLLGVQRFLEARPQPALVTVAGGAASANEILLIAGRINADGVSFEPVHRARGVAPLVTSGAYRLRVTTTAGGSFEYPFDPVEVDHVAGEQHFFVTVPSPGALAALDVVRSAAVVSQRAGSRAKVQGGATAAGRAAPNVQWQETGTRLEVTWDADAARYLNVTHQLNGVRTTLAIDRIGGRARIDIASLPHGGEYEFSLSNGLDAHLTIVAR